MKKKFIIGGLTILCMSVSVSASAQKDRTARAQRMPKWVSENGYWNVVSNVHTPGISTISFYNNAHQLMYKEKVEGMVMRLKKRKVKMCLKKVLDQSFIAFNAKQKAAENEMLVVNQIR